MYNLPSGILMLFFNLKHILQEMLMILSLYLILSKQKYKISLISKKSKKYIKKEAMEVKDMIINGKKNKQRKIY